MRCQSGNLGFNLHHRQITNTARAVGVEVRVVFELLRVSGEFSGGNPVEQSFGIFRAELLEKFFCGGGQFQQRNFFSFRDLADGFGIITVRICQLAGLIKLPPRGGRGKNGSRLVLTRLADEAHEIRGVFTERCCAAIHVVGFFVVVTELDDDEIARLDRGNHFVPTSFGDEGFCAAPVLRVILYTHRVLEIHLEHLSPAALRIRGDDGFVRHCGIANHVNGDAIGLSHRRQCDTT